MTRSSIIIPLLLALCVSCTNNTTQINKFSKEIDSLSQVISQRDETIRQLRDSVTLLAYPADQRLETINRLVAAAQFSDARKEISDLKSLFPESKEAKSIPSIIERIDRLEAAKIAEEQRIKALGFKAIKTQTTVKVDYNTVTISGISLGKSFVFDWYDDYYHYFTADRGNKYCVAPMSVKSESKNPLLPQLAFYQITGDRMNLLGTFTTRMARWDDYGSYLGNTPDLGNDFAKTSTVSFKLGIEIPEDCAKEPYAIVMQKINALVRNYDRWSNPPISYTGEVNYPQYLHLEDFTGDDPKYVAIKVANLK